MQETPSRPTQCVIPMTIFLELVQLLEGGVLYAIFCVSCDCRVFIVCFGQLGAGVITYKNMRLRYG